MTTNSPRVALEYLGCKVNQAEVEELGESFRQAGYVVAPPDEDADVYVLNSCTVTHVADRKTRLLIHQAGRRNPRPLIIVTGCYPTVDPLAVAAIAGVDLVVPNADKARLVEIVRARISPSSHAAPDQGEGDTAPSPCPSPYQGEGWGEGRTTFQRTRAMLKVEDGCDHFCTYCIVPAARGPVHSIPIAAAVEQIQRRVDLGCQEVVLTGVALGSYGRDLPQGGQSITLLTLVEAILSQTTVPRLRLSSIEPENLDPVMLDLWSDRRFCRHLHLPLQSGCDATLKRMGRRYRTADYTALVAQARAIAPDAAITTDIIVGFPGETEDEFAQTYAFAQAAAFAKIHVFRYSARHGTAATRLPGRISESDKKQRAAALLALSEGSGSTFRRQFIGSRRTVLWEEQWKPQRGAESAPLRRAWWSGRSDNYIRVYARHDEDMHNRLTSTRLVAEMEDGLAGEIA